MFKRIILPGIVAGAAILAAGIAVSATFSILVPSMKSEYENVSIFRTMSDPLMALYFIHPFFLGLVLAWIWDKTKRIFSSESISGIVFNFAVAYWLVSVAGMLISYGTFQLSFAMVLSWTIALFFEAVFAGVIFSKMNPIS